MIAPEISAALVLAQLQSTLARLDAGTSGNARVQLYSTNRPGSIADAYSDTPQAAVVLARPCGAIVSGVLVLYPLDAAGATVMAAGIPRWGELLAADGTLLVRGDVTDMEHGGFFRVGGAETPEGETSPMFYAGAKVQLGATALS
jgi:hypothetical protein